MRLLLIFSIYFLCSPVTAGILENPCGLMYPLEWGETGLGFLYFDREMSISCYDSGMVRKIGTLKKSFGGYLSFIPLNAPGLNLIEIRPTDYLSIGYGPHIYPKGYSLDSEGNILIMTRSIHGGVWVRDEDIQKLKGEVLSYSDVILGDPDILPAKVQKVILDEDVNIGVNLIKSCLNLRKAPSVQADKITCILSNDWQNVNLEYTHLKILKKKGKWVQVIATTYIPDEIHDEVGDGCVPKVLKTHSGWLRAIDDTGYPNIWYSFTTY